MGKRWEERLEDLEKAINRLEEAIEESKQINFSTLKDGVIQRFEFTLELSWKALKYFFNSEGVESATTPKSTVKEAFKLGVLKNIDIWLEMIDDKNLTSHIYSQSITEKIYKRIVLKYCSELRRNFEFLKASEI